MGGTQVVSLGNKHLFSHQATSPALYLGFYVGVWGLNSGPPVSITSILPIELFSSPQSSCALSLPSLPLCPSNQIYVLSQGYLKYPSEMWVAVPCLWGDSEPTAAQRGHRVVQLGSTWPIHASRVSFLCGENCLFSKFLTSHQCQPLKPLACHKPS